MEAAAGAEVVPLRELEVQEVPGPPMQMALLMLMLMLMLMPPSMLMLMLILVLILILIRTPMLMSMSMLVRRERGAKQVPRPRVVVHPTPPGPVSREGRQASSYRP